MEKEDIPKGKTINKDEIFHKGQGVIYKGREAKVINVNPVLTIRIMGEDEIICGNIVDEVSLQGSQTSICKNDIKIDKAVLQKTTKCNNTFGCLSGDKKCLCKVTGSIGFDIKDIKPKPEIDCTYHFPYGDNSLCICPTRNEIYNRYRI